MTKSMHAPLLNPHTEYTRRLDERRTEVTRLARLSERVSSGRLLMFLLAVAIFWFGLKPGLLSGWWLLLPIAVFVGLLVFHERVRQAMRLAGRGVSFYERGLARLEDRWSGQGEPGVSFLDEDHPYARDLDLFGQGSLFELLNTTRTRGGEQTLADWLRAPATPEEIHARQAAVDELRSHVDLRERLALRGEDARSGVHPEALITWAQQPVLPNTERLRLAAVGLVSFVITSLIAWNKLGFSPVLLVLALLLEGAFALRVYARVHQILTGVARAGRDLALLSAVLACFEEEQFLCPRLVTLRAALDTAGLPPSRQIAKLRRLITLLESGKNQIFIPFAALLLWDIQVGLAIEVWRRNSGPGITRWLAAVGELEALCALASYAYEHPADPFPEIATAETCFTGDSLGHPLIPDARCVRNDVHLTETLRVLIVSGSNMSGKSTLLRTVGINAVLALAGAPVRARRLRLSPLALGATLRIQDSLQAGSSRFYAEITRIRLLMDLARGPLPLLFLLDEIFHGTNSHDRQIGAQAVIRGLVERGAIGLVTTHDLALVHIAETLAPRAANVCFEDHLEDGKLVFDYRMRPGIVQKSNALALMRSVGLEV